MAQFSLLLIGFLVLSGVSAFSTDAEFDNFMLYTHKFNKTYAGFEEFSIRFENFKQSLVRIAERNARSVSATYGLTRFSDMSPEEFRSTMLRARPPAPTDPSHVAAVERAVARQVNQQVNDLPKTVDWRDKNAITYVKDQGQCGSCWAFATTEEVESYWFMAGHQLTDLSPQQIVSCDKVDQGCDGGDPATAYQYVAQYGLQTDDAYPYFSGDDGFTGDCEANYSAVVAHIKSFEYAVPPCNDTCTHQDEDAMAAVVANTGPLSVLVDAESWQDYQFGIIGGDCPSDASSLDHAVQLVGYDFSDSSMPFWIVRNSWSEDWGNMGYVYIAKGGNYCGIADGASYPVV